MIPSAPMQFISLDIAHMPKDTDGYQYMFLVGDLFSKYIDAIPLRDQTAKSVVNAFSDNWLYHHGNPYYLLSDQGSNVDGEVVRDFCNQLGIEKRRSSAYHSQGNGFAERNIRNVKDILRAALLHRNLAQSKWRRLLPELVFALNCSDSKAINCIPYKVVFGRVPTLPVDIRFGMDKGSKIDDVITAAEYFDERSFVLQDMFDVVIQELNLSKAKIIQQYNQNLRVNNYKNGDKVWLKVKYYKTGENRKLAPRRGGPWTVVEKLPNGVNFRIRNDNSSETKVVHHDRLSPVRSGVNDFPTIQSRPRVKEQEANNDTYTSSSESSADISDDTSDWDAEQDSEQSSSDSDSDGDNGDGGAIERRYPQRERVQRNIPGAIPWNAMPKL